MKKDKIASNFIQRLSDVIDNQPSELGFAKIYIYGDGKLLIEDEVKNFMKIVDEMKKIDYFNDKNLDYMDIFNPSMLINTLKRGIPFDLKPNREEFLQQFNAWKDDYDKVIEDFKEALISKHGEDSNSLILDICFKACVDLSFEVIEDMYDELMEIIKLIKKRG